MHARGAHCCNLRVDIVRLRHDAEVVRLEETGMC